MTVAGIDRRAGRGAWVAVGIGWIVVVAAVVAWPLVTRADRLIDQLKAVQFWSLEACAVLVVALGLPALKGALRDASRQDGVRIAGLMALAAALTLFVAPRTNRIYYDEHIYQGIGHNLADLKRAQVCNDATVQYGRLQCQYAEYNKQPYAYPHVLSVLYRLVGARSWVAHAVNAAAMALTTAAVYLLVWLLFGDRLAAWYAGLLVALTPEQILWSATAAVEPTASLSAVAALVFVAHACRGASGVALFAAAAAVAYAVQFRPESFLIVPVAGVLIWPRARRELGSVRLWWAGLLFLALSAVHIAHLFAVRDAGWGTSAARLSVGYLAQNFTTNGAFFVLDERFPVAFTLLAVVGLGGRTFRAERLAMALYFLLFFGIFLLFYAGSYNYGADVRYSLLTVPAVAVLGGLGAARVARWFAGGAGTRAAAVTAALCLQFLWYLPLVRATGEEAWAARADVSFARRFARELPSNAYVLTHNPGMFHLWGVSAGQLSLVSSNPQYLDFLIDRYSAGVYVHWNFWCNVQEPVQPAFCRTALQLRPTELAREHRERDQHFAFYRLK
jgi:hypothetical protein